MNDIWIAVAVMTCISVLAALLTSQLLYRSEGQSVILGITLAVFATVVFQIYASGQLFWAKVFPTSAAIIYSNLAAIFAALAAGWAWRLPETPLWRRAGLSSVLGVAALIAICWPLYSIVLRPPPEGKSDWAQGVAMQSSWATCSPAAAATFLTAEGIPVDEREMVPLCLTDRSGTSTLGLYRGIKVVADRHERSVEIVDRDLAKLLEDDDWPVLMAVRLPFGVDDPRYANEWGWIPGMGHSVVALGRGPGGTVIVGDPSVGLEAWTVDDLQILWHGVGMRLHHLDSVK